jgi:hypothetical protein
MTTRLPNPFDHHDLVGWAPAQPGVRFPPSFRVERADDVHLLCASPVSAPQLHRALGLGAAEPAVQLDERGDAHACAWGETLADEDVELVHLGDPDAAVHDLPVPLLAAPESLPPGSRAALSVQDGCHGAVLSRDPDLLARCLGRFLDAYVEAASGDCGAVPGLAEGTLQGLLARAPEGATCRPSLEMHPRYWVLVLSWQSEDGEALHTERWIAEGPGGRWRAGWRW